MPTLKWSSEIASFSHQLPTRSPNAVVLPSWTLSAVTAVPGGAHPSYTHGYYPRDNSFYIEWDEISRDREKFLAWMQTNVLEAHPEDFAARPPLRRIEITA